MSYLGNSPGVASQRVESAFTATSNQTVFTPTSGYTLGYCDVYQNGVKLVNGDDYTASDGATVTLTTGAATGDSIVIVASFPRGLSDGYLKSEADARYSLVTDATATANGVVYRNSSNALTTGSALTFDGSTFTAVGLVDVDGVSGSSLLRLRQTTAGAGTEFNTTITENTGVTFDCTDGGTTARSFIWTQVGSEQMRLTSTGLGIGTTSPASKLNVSGGPLYLDNTVTGDYLRFRGSTIGFYGGINSTAAYLGTYTSHPLTFYTGGTLQATFDTSGNVGLGQTPSSWGGAFRGLDIQAAGGFAGSNNATMMTSNMYHNGTDWYYKNASATPTGLYYVYNGSHNWYSAVAGTGAVGAALTQKMMLHASGGLSLGNTTDLGAGNLNLATGKFLSWGGGEVLIYGDTTTGYMYFRTAGTEKVRLDNSGNFLVGTTSASAFGTTYRLWAEGGASQSALLIKSTAGTGYEAASVWNTATAGDNYFIYFRTEAAGTARGSINYNRGGGLTAYNTTSDYRAKTVNGAVQNALAKVALLKPSTGRMNDAEYDIDFFVAHELQEVVPSAVTGEKDAVNEDGTPKYQMVDKSALIPLLTAAIQEQQAIIEQLKTDVATLKGTP